MCLTKIWCFKLAASACLFVLAACSAPHYQASDFYPEQVSCTDKSSPELHAKFEEFKRNPDGDLYWIAHYDEIAELLKALANQGDIDAMRLFGDFRYEMIFEENIASARDSNGYIKGVAYPERERRDMTEALTYSYMATIPESAYKNEAQRQQAIS